MQTVLTLAMLSALAGASHAMAPDHWVPASILGWQRRWGALRSALVSAVLLCVHVLMGAGIYFAFDDQLRELDPSRLFPYSLAAVVAIMVLRCFRYGRIREMQRAGPHLGWALVGVMWLLGPCESIIPVFLKAASLGVGYLVPLVAFLAGSVIVGAGLSLLGRLAWDRPLWLIRAFGWADRRLAVLPAAAGVALGLRFLFKM